MRTASRNSPSGTPSRGSRSSSTRPAAGSGRDIIRDYAALNEATCADLIESFKAEGRQNFPAIVRRVESDSEHEWEVVCGARRHWTAGWMRAHHQPDFKFLVEPRELTDEEAFRLADLENRSRRDLSDYERAHDYARAVERYYGGSQQQMAERLEVSRSWLSRYLELARLPAEIVRPSPHPMQSASATQPSWRRCSAPMISETGSSPRPFVSPQSRPGWSDVVSLRSPAGVMQRLTNAGRAQTVTRRARVSENMSSGHLKGPSSREGKVGAGEGG